MRTLRHRLLEKVPVDVAKRRLATLAGAVGLGLAAIVFARLGDRAQALFLGFEQRWPWAVMLATPAMFGLIAWLTSRFCAEARSSGIPQVIAASRSPEEEGVGPLVSLRTAAFKFWATLAMLMAGGSVGREGPTVQISAAIMVAVHRLLRVPITAGVVIAGGAAGVAAAFNTPLAGVAFAIEELAAAFEQRVTMMVMGAVVVSGLVSLSVSGDYVYFGAMRQTLDLGSVMLIAPLAGLAGGFCGGLFSRMVLGLANPSRGWVRRIRSRPVLLAVLCGVVVALAGLASGGATWGTGYETTRALVEGASSSSEWFGLAKFIATLATALSGVPGGIFAPSLSIGAGMGQAIGLLFPDDPRGAVVLLGMIGYFVGVVRAPLTAVIILIETTASRGMIMPLFATALIADLVSARVCREKLYHGLARSFTGAIQDKDEGRSDGHGRVNE